MSEVCLATAYATDPAAKTLKGFILGLEILAQYMDKGRSEKYFCGAEHDEISIYVADDLCPPESEHGVRLYRLGFQVNECGTWSWYP